MNFQYIKTLSPIKVLVVNPLSPAGQLTIVKILSGSVFGSNQLIDLILLVYFNERSSADTFKRELYSCAFSCINTIEVSSDLPNVSDADVFCFITNFANPNLIDFNNIEYNEHFDTMYLIIKIAYNFSKLQVQLESGTSSFRNQPEVEDKTKKPIFVSDGLVAMDILYVVSKYLPPDELFCPTPLPALAKSVVGNYVKVKTCMINNVLAWGASDQVFHVEIEKPLIIKDNITKGDKYYRNTDNKDEYESLNMDHTQFNESWLKKELIDKVLALSKKNPYGCIFKASELAKTLKAIWTVRNGQVGKKCSVSLGVISDGSLGTIKGCSYVLPIDFCGETWSVSKRFEEDYHLKGMIKRINKSVKTQHEKLVPYCKKFLEANVIRQAFVPDDNTSEFSLVKSQCSANMIN